MRGEVCSQRVEGGSEGSPPRKNTTFRDYLLLKSAQQRGDDTIGPCCGLRTDVEHRYEEGSRSAVAIQN